MSPYRKNDIGLNTTTLPENVDLAITNKTVIPTRGAVVRADYIANVGLRALLTLKQNNQQPVPFGALVNLMGNEGRSAIVDEAGQVYLTGMPPQGTLDVARARKIRSAVRWIILWLQIIALAELAWRSLPVASVIFQAQEYFYEKVYISHYFNVEFNRWLLFRGDL